MHFVSFKELYKEVFRRASLMSIPNASELMVGPESEWTRWEIFAQYIREALQVFDYHYPLQRTQPVNITVDYETRKGTYATNFDAWRRGILDENQITLPMKAVTGLSYNGYATAQTLLRDFRFNSEGQFDTIWYQSGRYWCVCICNHPFVEEYDEAGNLTDQSGIYYISKDLNSQYTIFRDQCYVTVARGILENYKNARLSNVPIELFQGLEENVQKVESTLEQRYQSAIRESYYIA